MNDTRSCPCELTTEPCSDHCTCHWPVQSGGCRRCCKYGSPEQQLAAAKQLIERERLARLGAACEADKIYHCPGCNKWKAEPAHVIKQKEIVNVDCREVTTWDLPYCSDECAAKHKDYEQT